MSQPRFIQIHSLHSYSAALLNRDDSGLSKRLLYGNAVRTRVSSQCLKRHWRTANDEYAIDNIDAPASFRSRHLVERQVMSSVMELEPSNREVVEALTRAFNIGIYGKNGENVRARQVLLFGEPEVAELRSRALEIYKAHPDDPIAASDEVDAMFSGTAEARANFKAFRASAALPAGLIGAMFGRMDTSDPMANIDSSIHVGHAFTVHREESESDYFSVVDDLMRDGEAMGSAHIGETELSAGLFYGYVVIDVPTLVSNVEGCSTDDWQDAESQMAGQIASNLLHLIATVSPGSKRGSTAPYSYADFMLVEAGASQPRSLDSAFRVPVQPHVGDAVDAMSRRLERLDTVYDGDEQRRYMSVEPYTVPGASELSLNALAFWVGDAIRAGRIPAA